MGKNLLDEKYREIIFYPRAFSCYEEVFSFDKNNLT